MRKTTVRRSNNIVGTILVLAILNLVISASTYGPEKRNVEGVWRVAVTPRNCSTGVPVPAATFQALVTFHKDGTVSAWFQNSTITVTRSPGHGLWKKERGWSDFSFKFVHLRYDISTGAFLGSQEAVVNLEIDESNDAFSWDGSTTQFDVNGAPVGTPGCSNAVGTRYKFE